jgi:hypothetical protein
MRKRGESGYISWILIVAAMVVLGYLVYNWTISKAKDTSDYLGTKSSENACTEVSFSIDGICQDTQNLYMNITNTGLIKITDMQARLVDLYGNPENRDMSLAISPGDNERNFRVLKPGTVVINAKFIPIVSVQGKDITCLANSAQIENIDQC